MYKDTKKAGCITESSSLKCIVNHWMKTPAHTTISNIEIVDNCLDQDGQVRFANGDELTSPIGVD